MKKMTFILILCFGVFFYSFSSKKETTQISNDNSNIVKSLVQTTDYLKLQVNSPMKLAEYTANKNDKSSLIKSVAKDIIFIPNKGQIIDTEGKLRPDILYKAELNGVDLYLTNKGMSFVFYNYEDAPKNLAAGNKETKRLHDPFKDDPVKDSKVKMYRMDLDIVGMNTNARTLNEEQTVEYFNYYYAHCSDGITNVHGYRKVIFENVYNNIDLIYYSNEKGLKYDFIVKPGGDVADIKLKYRNEDEVYITEEGKIRALNPFGELKTDVLYTYQSDGKTVESNYKKDPDGTISINTREYDKTKDLIIDPYIGATYYGGNGSDAGNSITTDANNNILVTGSTSSSNFPLQNLGSGAYFQGTNLNRDAFILKFNSNGILLWATFYGGNGFDYGYSITTDLVNNVLVTGWTTSNYNFPLHNPGGGAYFQNTGGGYDHPDAFILKFNSSSIRQWATYYGGDSVDCALSIIADGNNNILVTGYTLSADFPVYNPGSGNFYQGSLAGSADLFILKFNSNCIRQWATYYGGYLWDIGNSITTNGNNDILITGNTESANFPIYNPGGSTYFQGTLGGYNDILILKFNSAGSRQWATHYGSNCNGYSITTDDDNNILVTGFAAFNFPLYNPGGGAYFQDTIGGLFDAIITKFTSTGVQFWSTYYGGNGSDYGCSITTDENNNILITGYTNSTNFPVHNPGGGAYFQGTYSGSGKVNAFILKFSSSGVQYWATYYGGSGGWLDGDRGHSINSDGNNNILVTGYTWSSDFPVKDPGGGAYYQSTFGGGILDAFILGFRPSGAIRIQALTSTVPNDYALHQNYPNPFNPTTSIKFDLHKSSQTKLIVYDILGKEIIRLVNEKLSAGSYEVSWDGSDYPSGVYLYKLITDEFVDVKKMLMIK